MLVDLSHAPPPGETIFGLLALSEMGLPAVLLGDATELDRLYPDHGMLLVPGIVDTHALAGILFGITQRQDEVAELLQESGQSRERINQLDRQLDRLHHELKGASELQKRSLPHPLQSIAGGSINTLWKPAGQVSGDLAQVIKLTDGCTAMVVADSIGHGVPAAMLSMILQRTLTEAHQSGEQSLLRSPSRMLSLLNESLVRTAGDETRFATAIYAVFDSRTNGLRVGAAGHPTPIVSRPDGTSKRLPVQGPLLGLFAGESYPDTEWTLAPADRVVLYSDGIEQVSMCRRSPRCTTAAEAVEDLVRAASVTGEPALFIERIEAELEAHEDRRTGEDIDDLTMLCLTVDPLRMIDRRAA
ncbi:MAG: hypothetical protein CMJ41_01070 [Phycisphaerae bacterium]|nr:hypothetical protein [Phycisphaerae bacterium]